MPFKTNLWPTAKVLAAKVMDPTPVPTMLVLLVLLVRVASAVWLNQGPEIRFIVLSLFVAGACPFNRMVFPKRLSFLTKKMFVPEPTLSTFAGDCAAAISTDFVEEFHNNTLSVSVDPLATELSLGADKKV